jgi:glycine/D-amino acid oxidase-like deaminating enzyme
MTTESLASAVPHPLWWDGIATRSRSALSETLDVDVAIVGAGYTGLWTAHSLLELDPSLSIVIVDRAHVGFGASGRNGGWCYDGFAAGPSRIEAMSDLETARNWSAALRDMVDEVGKVVASEGIDCDFHRGGSVEFLRNGGQVARAVQSVETARRYGWSESDLRIVSAEEATAIAKVAGVHAGMWSSHTAALHPAKLVHGLAAALERRGVRIFESTEVVGIEPGKIRTAGGHEIAAPAIVRATEGYTAELDRSHHRALAPLYSLMIATEPLSEDRWKAIGLSDRQTFGDLRHLVIYGQRTADGRIAFGGRGAPYAFGSRIINAEFPVSAFAKLREALVELLPQVADVSITHRWGGVLGVSRNWMPTVGFDPIAGIGWAGGYVGSGVAATNLAGRTLADLITGADTDLTRFPWVNRVVRSWEPEPFRWIGINAALQVMTGADRAEQRTDKPSKRAELLWRLATK